MSELINFRNRSNVRFGLLVTTSAIALAACVASVTDAIAADRPTVWVEGGWHFDSVTGSNDIVVPPLDDLTANGFPSTPTASNFLGQGAGGFPSFTEMEKALGRSQGAEGSISFQPKGSDWVFSISGRYGRTHTHRRLDQRHEIVGETADVGSTGLSGYHKSTAHYANYVIQANDNKEAHVILDFQVGRDAGIGLFGDGTQSVFGFGARYAQMNMSSNGHAYAAPAVRFYGHHGRNFFGKYGYSIFTYHQNSATTLERHSSFQGIGPSLSWSNTTGLLGDVADGQLALDWGANAAVLFGRQKVKINYSTLTRSFDPAIPPLGGYVSASKTVHRTQSHRITVPNLGGFAALSYRFTNAKISVGYRGDFFFGAMDRGLDTRRSVTTGFNGPFATISVGLGG
ncbi:MAG TPA: hypothetical protein VHD95_01890 [Rhizomicrobium sp.]|jgi:hypothetical protein|nr:hypothetical protein [Rhizomicrobium sp.]